MPAAYSESDLAKFQTHFGLPQQLVRNVSAGSQGLAQAEANLDIQCKSPPSSADPLLALSDKPGGGLELLTVMY